ncbi:UNVERIFIED_CONTAM: hypothetical protein GTU68_040419 [Idotea baltica]|nr:hypothetical protein [Idotea baltica]
MQKDAMERLGLSRMLLEPELLESVEADVELVATLISLNQVIPAKTKDTARKVVAKVVEELERKLKLPLIQTLKGALNKSIQTRRPKWNEIDWHRTIQANLKHYQPKYKTIIPEKQFGYGRKGGALKEIILCVDQSGSMASSVVYASVFGAVLASMRSLKTHMVAFDTSVVELTENLHDPVELLFGVQLGGGTDIHKALTYCQQLIRRPKDTILVLISDLFEGGSVSRLINKATEIKSSGVQVITLLALNDEGKPFYHQEVAQAFTELEIPTFGCTPDIFGELMAAAISGREIRI